MQKINKKWILMGNADGLPVKMIGSVLLLDLWNKGFSLKW